MTTRVPLPALPTTAPTTTSILAATVTVAHMSSGKQKQPCGLHGNTYPAHCLLCKSAFLNEGKCYQRDQYCSCLWLPATTTTGPILATVVLVIRCTRPRPSSALCSNLCRELHAWSAQRHASCSMWLHPSPTLSLSCQSDMFQMLKSCGLVLLQGHLLRNQHGQWPWREVGR